MPASGSNSAIRKTCDAARHFDRRRALVWLGQALIAGSAAASSAFAQYPSSGQTYSSPYTPPYTPVYMQQARPQPGNQTDEQLLTVGRLLEQQGRYAQAQRIYTELERRRLAGFQQPMRMPPNVPFQAPPGMVPQAAVSSGAWQAAPAPMASAAPVMQLAPQVSPPMYSDSRGAATSPVPPVVSAPQVPPSESFVIDREVTPPPKTITPEQTEGWHSAVAPLPAALRSGQPDSTMTLQQQVSGGSAQPESRLIGLRAGGPAVAEPSSLPDLPIAPVPPFGAAAMQFPPPLPRRSATSEPARFMSPTVASAERRALVVPESESATPPTMRLRPMSEKNVETLEPDRDAAQQLTKQANAIRIIPGQRIALQLKPETDGSLDNPLDRPTNAPAADRTNSGGTPNVAAATNAAEQRTPSSPQRALSDNPPRFDLAAWVATPEFREIHTGPVLEGLELLARPEPQHRAWARCGLQRPVVTRERRCPCCGDC